MENKLEAQSDGLIALYRKYKRLEREFLTAKAELLTDLHAAGRPARIYTNTGCLTWAEVTRRAVDLQLVRHAYRHGRLADEVILEGLQKLDVDLFEQEFPEAVVTHLSYHLRIGLV
jgi:hypothetical protein